MLARGRDTRLSDAFIMSLEERLERGKAIAPFHPDDSNGGDPLGDTYHFWANVAGGLYAGTQRSASARAAFVAVMLYAGPWLMQTIREGVFGSRLFYGNHARIDRLGLTTGLRLARAGSSEASRPLVRPQ